MRKIVGRLSYRFRLSLIIALIALMPLALFGVVYLRSAQIKWKENAMLEYVNVIALGSERLNNLIIEMKQKCIYLTNNQSVSKALANRERETMEEALDLVYLLRDTVAMVSADNTNMKVHWYSDKAQRTYDEYYRPIDVLVQGVQDQEMLEQILHLKAGELFVVLHNIEMYGDGGADYICVYTQMYDADRGSHLLEIRVPISKVLDLEYAGGEQRLMDMAFPEGSIIGVQMKQTEQNYSFLLSEETETARRVWNGYLQKGDSRGYYEIVHSLDNVPGGGLVCLVTDEFVDSLILWDRIGHTLILAMILLLVLASVYVAVSIFTTRLNLFLNNVNKKLDDILDFKDNMAVENDFAGIEEKVIQLVQSAQKYENENNRLELELLQMRFNPHLLYNTLIGIRYQIQDTTTRQSIDSLIRYYRIVLSKGHLIIRIEEEIKMIEEYLKIAIFTYQLSNVKFQFEVEDEAKDLMIVKHLLQPIVENAVEHGLRAKKMGGYIWIRVKLTEKDVVFEIEDNGAGMTPQQIEGVLSAPVYSSIGGGYGIYNVKQRIETYYGKEYGISFHSKVGEGTLAVLRIPQAKGEKSEETK